MSLERCPTHGPFVADRSTDFGETWCPECGPMPNPSNSDLVGEARRLSAEIAQHIADAAALLPELAQQLEQARAENARLRGWPEIKVGTQSPAHSPVDRYRCENLDCEIESVWEFRPDDYELDESIVNCPACGEEGELFFRWFRGGAALTPDEGADPPVEAELPPCDCRANDWVEGDEGAIRCVQCGGYTGEPGTSIRIAPVEGADPGGR